jgi:hypothetical protein
VKWTRRIVGDLDGFIGMAEAVDPALFDLATQIKAPRSLADLGLEAGAIEAVGEAVSAAPISAADLYPARSRLPTEAGLSR